MRAIGEKDELQGFGIGMLRGRGGADAELSPSHGSACDGICKKSSQNLGYGEGVEHSVGFGENGEGGVA